MRAASYPARLGRVNRFSERGRAPAPDAPPAARTMPIMPMRVAFLAAECEPWAKTGGLADVVDALARALGQLGATRSTRPVDVFLPRYRGVPVPAGRRADAGPRRAGSASPRRATTAVTVLDVAGRRLPAAPGRPPGGLRPRRVLRRRDGRLPRQRLAVRAVLPRRRSRRSGPTAGRSTSSTSTTGTPGPAAIYRDARYARRPDRRAAPPIADDPPQPRLPRLDAARRRSASSGCAPGDGVVPRDADGHRPPAAPASSGPSSSTRSRPGSPREALTPEFGMGLDGALRGQGRPVLRDPQRPRHRRLGPGHRRRPGRAVLARPTAPARRPAGRTC